MPQEQSTPICQFCTGDCSAGYGYCHCGCGEKAKIATITSKKYHQVRGNPQQFIYGHRRTRKPIPPSELCICRDPKCIIPWGKCHCGCGQNTLPCLVTDSARDAVRGKPQKFIVGHTLRENSAKSIPKQIVSRTKHGMQKRGIINTTYYSWAGMKQRCLNPNNSAYSYYGGRGITICERWMKFENFLADMGEKPDKRLTLERINVNGNYEPSNCKWATMKEQMANIRPRGKTRPKLPPWTRVEHKLPKEYEVVSVVLYGKTTAGFISLDMSPRWVICSENGYRTDNVTHWMQLPQPPEGVLQNE